MLVVDNESEGWLGYSAADTRRGAYLIPLWVVTQWRMAWHCRLATWLPTSTLRQPRAVSLSRVARRVLGRAVLAPERLYAGVHHRVGLHGPAQTRVRQARHEDHRPQ